MAFWKRAYKQAKEANSAYSIANWGYRALNWIAPTAVGGVMAWAATYRDWIWNDYGMFGALGCGLVAALITGFALFLSGLGIAAWRGNSQPSNELVGVLSSTLSTQSDVEAAPTTAPRPWVAAPYTNEDVQRLLEVLFEVHQFVNLEPVAIEKQLHELREQWYLQVVSDGAASYLARLNAVIRQINAFMMSLNDLIYKKHPYYKNEIRAAMNIDGQWFPNDSASAVNQFAEKINALPEKPEMKTVRVLDEPFGQLLDLSWTKWSRWIPEANDRIDFMTGNLRKSGVTGYEKR